MPKAGKKESYDLRKSFYSPTGNAYRSPGNLEVWVRFTQTGPVDLGPFSLSFSAGSRAAYNLKKAAGLKDYYALEQDQSSQHVSAGTSSHWSSRIGVTAGTSSEYTIAAWINTSTMTKAYGTICSLGSFDIYFSRVRSSGDGYLYLQVDDTDGSSPRWRSDTPVPDNEWVHVAVTHDLSDLDANIPKFYLNGSEVPAAEYSSTGDNPFAGIESSGLIVGGSTPVYYGQHDIAEFCIWSKILSEEEIDAVVGVVQLHI